MAADVAFGDFMKYLLAKLHDADVDLPLKDERRWHDTFYSLKRSNRGTDEVPAFVAQLKFDWDGPYPKCRQLSEFLHALHWNAGVSALNPAYATIVVPGELAKMWNDRFEHLDSSTRQSVQNLIEQAKSQMAEAA
jgi:hypothetical protein